MSITLKLSTPESSGLNLDCNFLLFLPGKKNLSLLGMCPLYILLLALLPQLALGEFLQDLIVALWKYNCTILPHFTVYHSFSSKLKEKKSCM